MTEQDFIQEYSSFIDDMSSRCSSIGLNLSDYAIDHVCYRAQDLDSYNMLFELLKSLSVVYTTKLFHERKFHAFFLRMPLEHNGISSYLIEFAEPGGSDSYSNGFQHLELLTPKSYEDILTITDDVKKLFFEGKFGDEKYIKWEDKKVLKLKRKPLYYESLAEDNSEVTVI